MEQGKSICATERLVLREFTLDDLDTLAPITADPAVMEFSIRGPWDCTRTREFLGRCVHDYSPRGQGYGRWAVIHRGDARLIGFAGLGLFESIDGRSEVEIGFRLLPSYWGRGLGTEAAGATRDAGFELLGLGRLIALIQPENTRSVRVAEKIGMTLEKQIEKWDQAIHVYVATREERGSRTAPARTSGSGRSA
jgi:RimJ/RimL family protein N-acetyltransferase